MFVLTSKIEIGNFVFNSITEVEVMKSVEELSNTAKIKMPSKFRVRQNGEFKKVEEAIKVGDKVKITLGYERRYEGVEFMGFVTSIGSKIPLEIKCEDAIWLLRRKNINKAFNQKTTLKEILKEVVKDTSVELSDKIPHVPIEKMVIRNNNGAKVLQDLKQNLGISIYLDDEGKLYAGLEQVNNIGKEVLYDLNYNLVENNLEYKSADQKRLKVRYTYIDKKNKKKSIEVGDQDGELRTFHTSVLSDEKKMRELANAEMQKLKYDGFEGSVKTFLIPFATPGMAAKIIDNEHKNREGKYFIKKVVTTFGTSGARREVTISNKL
ncbi:late control protein [Riemerella anatipestifer]|uniref:Late control protein n=1 Tax=Riemerella anatipestifer TaxID=34085 RepID=A0AAP6LME7_RIEAN|nr:late control protein [Riemerella anatipestifer]MDY3512956.1 late control protein [Riemerella anatipestifer]USL95222.1 late control protein [Riemerella anatipestifer]